METLLKSGLAYYTGTCDRTGHPIIAVPYSGQQALLSAPADDFALLLRRFIDVAPVQQKLNGFSVVADLSRSATAAVAERLVAVLARLQSENRKAISSLLLIKPSSWKRRRQLAKLTGYRDVKKGRPPKTPFQVLAVRDAKGLQQHADRSSLLEELGGTVHIKKDLWVQFYTLLDSTLDACEKCLAAADGAKRQEQETSQLSVPTSAADIAELIAKVDHTYKTLFEQLKLDAAIDGCTAVLSKLQQPDEVGSGNPGSPSTTAAVAASSALTRLLHADLLREVARRTRLQQTAVVELRDRLQMAEHRARARLVQAAQLCEHRKLSRKICKWISSTALPRLDQLAGVPDSTGAMKAASSLLDDEFRELVKTVALEPAERVFTDVEYMAMQESAELKQSQSFVGQLRDSVQLLQDALATAEQMLAVGPALLIAIEQLSSWMSNVIANLRQTVPVGSGSTPGITAWLDICAAAVVDAAAAGHEAPAKAVVNSVVANLRYLRNESKKQQVQKLVRGVTMLVEINLGDSLQVDGAELAAWWEDLSRQCGPPVDRQTESAAQNSDPGGFSRAVPSDSSEGFSSSPGGGDVDQGRATAARADDALEKHQRAGSPLNSEQSEPLGTDDTIDAASAAAESLERHSAHSPFPEYVLLLPADGYEPAAFASDFVPPPAMQKSADMRTAAAEVRTGDPRTTSDATAQGDGPADRKASIASSSSHRSGAVASLGRGLAAAAAIVCKEGEEVDDPQMGSALVTSSPCNEAAAAAVLPLDAVISEQRRRQASAIPAPTAACTGSEPAPHSEVECSFEAATSLPEERAAGLTTTRRRDGDAAVVVRTAAPKLSANFKEACLQRERLCSDARTGSDCSSTTDSDFEDPVEARAAAPTTSGASGSAAIAAAAAVANAAAPFHCRIRTEDVPGDSVAAEVGSAAWWLVPGGAQPLQRCWWQLEQQPYTQALDDIERDKYLTAEQKLAQMVDLIESVDLGTDEPLCCRYSGAGSGWAGKLLLLPPFGNSSSSEHPPAADASVTAAALRQNDVLDVHPTSARLGITSSYYARARSGGSSSPNSVASQKNAFQEWLLYAPVDHLCDKPSRPSSVATGSASVLETIRQAELVLQD